MQNSCSSVEAISNRTASADQAFANVPTPKAVAKLISAISAHSDKTAFATLFRLFAPKVKGYLLRRGARPQDAEDVAQEALLMVWLKAAQFDEHSMSGAGWIFTIARNLSIDRFRRDTLRQRVLQPESIDEPPSAECAMSRTQEEVRIRVALDKLPYNQAEILKRYYLLEETHSQLASSLNLPLGTVKSRISLALNRLRNSDAQLMR